MAIIAQSARYGSGLYGTSEYGVVNLTASISGVSATGTIASVVAGGFEVDVTERISTGVSATGSVGTLNVFIKVSLVGVSATGTIGTLAISNTVTLTGVSATGSVNTVEEKPTEALDSVSATGQIGIIKPNVAESVTGVEAEFNSLKPFTASGDAQLSTAEKKFGTASLLLDGTGDFVTTSYTSSLLTSSEWGVDFWVYSSTLTSQTAHLWDGQNSNSGFALRISSGNLQVVKDNSITRSVSGQLSNNTWHHIRLQRRYAFTEVFVDGFQRGQQAGAGYNAHTYVIGAKENGSEEFTGYIDEFRASTPTGLSAASFTLETEAYSLDGSTEALLHFDGANGSTTITNEASNVINLTLTGTANVTLVGVEAVGSVNTVEDKPTEVLDSVSATVFVNGNFTFSNTHSLTGVSATSTVNTVTATGVIFDFEAVKALYDRKRTVLIEKQAPRIVYVKAELPRIVYVDRQSTVAERRAAA